MTDIVRFGLLGRRCTGTAYFATSMLKARSSGLQRNERLAESCGPCAEGLRFMVCGEGGVVRDPVLRIQGSEFQDLDR